MPPSLLDSLVRRVSDGEQVRTLPVCSAFERMTAREREITLLIACGKSNKDIASHTGVSSHTLNTLVRNSMGKLGLPTRTHTPTPAHLPAGPLRRRSSCPALCWWPLPGGRAAFPAHEATVACERSVRPSHEPTRLRGE